MKDSQSNDNGDHSNKNDRQLPTNTQPGESPDEQERLTTPPGQSSHRRSREGQGQREGLQRLVVCKNLGNDIKRLSRNGLNDVSLSPF